MDQDLGNILINLSGLFGPIRAVIFAVGLIAGLIFTARGLYILAKLSAAGGDQNITPSKGFSNLFFGGVFATFGWFLGSVWFEIFREPGNISITAYSLEDATGIDPQSEFYDQVITAVFGFIQLAGFFFAFKGLLLMKQAAEGSNSQGESKVGAAFTHFLGGLACVNIGPFLSMVVGVATA